MTKASSKRFSFFASTPSPPPDLKEWTDFYSRFICLLILFDGGEDAAGTMARRLAKEMESLWLLLVSRALKPPTIMLRALRFGALWRKRSKSEKDP